MSSMSATDSNPSLDNTSKEPEAPEPELHGLAHGLALLKKKRKKFSASRNISPVVAPPTSISETVSKKVVPSQKIPQVLKRASSVPTRVPEVTCEPVFRHEITQSQQDSMEVQSGGRAATLSPFTTESVTATVPNDLPGENDSFREPLLYTSSSSNPATGSTQTPDEEFKTGPLLLNKLPGVIPLSGHNNAGWL